MSFERLESPDTAKWRSLLGRKVSVRIKLHDDPQHPFSEAIGIVQKVDDGRIEILNRRGEVTSFAESDLIAGKAWL